MFAQGEIFLDLHLPNATTWFYSSALLAVALFVKFSRLFSMRSLDVLALFLPMPGILLLLESHGSSRWGYVWLLAASGFFFVRCLVDLVLERRPTLAPNLSLGGMIWLSVALYAGLVAVACRPAPSSLSAEKPPTPLDEVVKQPVEKIVRSQTDHSVDDARIGMGVERGLALVCHLAIVIGLIVVGTRHFDDPTAAVATALFYLLLPYTFLLLPAGDTSFSRWDHAWPMVLLVWAVVFYRRPIVAGGFVGLAAGSALFPLFLVPLWFSFYLARGAWRFLFSLLLVTSLCLALLGLVIWINGELPAGLRSGWTLSHWQPWQAPPAGTPSAWEGVHWAYRLPVFILFLAVVLLTLLWPAPKNLAHLLALNTALLIAIQFWYSDRGGVYVLWYLPFLLLLVFRPNLSTFRPPNVPDFWMLRLARWVRRLVTGTRPRPSVPPSREVALPPTAPRR